MVAYPTPFCLACQQMETLHQMFPRPQIQTGAHGLQFSQFEALVSPPHASSGAPPSEVRVVRGKKRRNVSMATDTIELIYEKITFTTPF